MPTLREKILGESRVIAVVGLSPNPERDSYGVSKSLQAQGYRIIPVNPAAGVDEILGEKVYTDLKSIPFKVDLVDVFRRSEFVPPIVDETIEIGAKYLWLQDGVEDIEGGEKAEAAGLTVIMDD